ncbi:MAG: hypothetical protein Q7S98_00875 [Deltaproteobacteria bacterium]|nr:hypothetical protein [Deltaproteobacteria bacterium]
MVDCTRPSGFGEQAYCWGDVALSTTAGVLEATRTRWFREWHSVMNHGIVYIAPDFGSGPTIPVPADYDLETSVTRSQAYYPQAAARFGAKYLVRGLGLGAEFWIGYKAYDRISTNQSYTEGTLTQDGTLLAQSVVGAFATIRPARLDRAFWGHASLIVGGIGFFDNVRNGLIYNPSPDSPMVRSAALQLALVGLNYSLGVGWQEGRYASLAKDKQNAANLKNPGRASFYMRMVREGEPVYSPYAREELPGVPVTEVPATVTGLTVRNSRYLAYDTIDGVEKQVGFFDIHQPVVRDGSEFRPIGRPEITVETFPGFDQQSRLLRVRTSLLRQHPEALPTWSTQTTNPYISSTAAYQRSLPIGWRVTASVPKFEWTHDAISGRSILSNSPIKYINRDHRTLPFEAKGSGGVPGHLWRRYVSGPLLNARDTVRDYRTILRYMRETPRAYIGFAEGPQTLPRLRRSLVWSERPLAMAPIKKPTWWEKKWKDFGGEPPFEAGNWERMPTRAFSQVWDGRHGVRPKPSQSR